MKNTKKTFKSALEASDFLYGIDDGQINIGHFDEIEIIFKRLK